MSNPPNITAVLVDYEDNHRVEAEGTGPEDVAERYGGTVPIHRIGQVRDGYTIWHYEPDWNRLSKSIHPGARLPTPLPPHGRCWDDFGPEDD